MKCMGREGLILLWQRCFRPRLSWIGISFNQLIFIFLTGITSDKKIRSTFFLFFFIYFMPVAQATFFQYFEIVMRDICELF